jgi:DNA polymerase III alpha subunit
MFDIDLLPGTREKVEAFAAKEYGSDKVCSVGLWQTYKPKLALQDAARALGYDVENVIRLTKNLPDEFDDLEYKEAIAEYNDFRVFAETNSQLVKMAYRMVGGIKAQGRHAGGLIISSVPIKDHIPMTICSERWTSAWTEGYSPQLSKFGFVKFDLLGLKTLLYIKTCLELIEKNRGIKIEWSDINPAEDRAGWLIDQQGKRSAISLNDEESLDLARQLRTETVFQFETELAKSILAKGGVKSFNDLVVYTSLGRPGPLPMVESYIRRRDGDEKWEDDEHPEITERLRSTFNVCCYQEQLASLWRGIAGFTVPEAEAARKAVSKKWTDKLAPIKDKWVAGASKTIGVERAEEWWVKMETFGRYAFNLSHATAYILITHRCLYLKAHFQAEWWAAVMSDCDTDRLSKYMGYARAEGVSFGSIDIDNLSMKFVINKEIVTPGLTSIKNMNGELAENLSKKSSNGVKYKDIDDFVLQTSKNKIACERLIKLGAFDNKHSNRKALWTWYQYQYGSDDESKEMRRFIKCAYAWPMDKIEVERKRQADEFRKQYPTRKVIPPKIAKWLPKMLFRRDEYVIPNVIDDAVYESAKYLQLTRDNVMSLVNSDFALKELLQFERQYLGYCIHSPMNLFKHGYDTTISDAREKGILEAYIEKFTIRQKKTEFAELIVTDGTENAKVMVWSDDLLSNGQDTLHEGKGVRMRVSWKDKFKSFSLRSGSIVIPLEPVDAT